MVEKFETAIEEQTEILKTAKRRFDILGYVKLALLLLFLVSIYYMFESPTLSLYKVEAAILLLVQIVAWVFHARFGETVTHSSGIIEVNRKNLDRVEGKWAAFSDTGAEFSDPEHPYCGDLDIVGNKSLFQYLNVTHTWHGRQAFARDLLDAHYSDAEIEKRQAAVEELARDDSFADELEHRFARIGSDPAAPELVLQLQDSQPFTKSRLLRTLLLYTPLVLFVFVGLVVVCRWEQFYLLSVYLYAAQTCVWLVGLLATNKYIQSIGKLPFKLERYSEVFTLVAEAKFSSEGLKNIQSTLTTSDVSATEAMRELASITEKAGVRKNPIIYFLLNVLLLWDFNCAFGLEDWKSKYSPHCEGWFLALGELESLACLATFRRVSNHSCYPQISSSRRLEAEELGHPLIPNELRVTNPLRLRDDIVIISGSNMSGKTTYLRTVGINVVLARAGGPVCAKDMSFSDLQLATSMRIADDLNEGISTFYAELKRIKGILDAAKTNSNTLFLIDEIFRGTNSVDRLSGAQTVIKKLHELKVVGMITTHDLELCDMAGSASYIRNYSFAEYYKDGQICFDYKMHPGKSKTTNAKYLMELLGII